MLDGTIEVLGELDRSLLHEDAELKDSPRLWLHSIRLLRQE
jgi:hypothetical protein